jgi:NAD(P)-dependent dehydrogenase (short-subunit alcohol dehydrogenase family)
VALVTGGSRGLGFALAEELLSQGCRVAICARDAAELERAASKLRAGGGSVATYQCDLAHPDEARAMVRAVIEEMHGLDILINNAGIIQVGPAKLMKETDFIEAMDLMFWAPYHCIAEALVQFRKQGYGHIANISSIGGLVSVPHLLPYSSAKFALVGLSDGLAVELAAENIHVTTVTPGLMRTGSHIQAEFRGRAGAEYTWFGLAATMPFVAIAPSEAARGIVDGIRRSKRRVTLPLSARCLAAINGVAPEVLSRGLTAANAFLPGAANEGAGKKKGKQVGNAVVDQVGSDAVQRYQNLDPVQAS